MTKNLNDITHCIKKLILWFSFFGSMVTTEGCSKSDKFSMMENQEENTQEEFKNFKPLGTINKNSKRGPCLAVCAVCGWGTAVVLGIVLILVLSANIGQFYSPVNDISISVGTLTETLPSSINGVSNSIEHISGNLSEILIKMNSLENQIKSLCEKNGGC